jgi:Protein of unknown function (DUF3300)
MSFLRRFANRLIAHARHSRNRSEVAYEVREQSFTAQIWGGNSKHDHSGARGYRGVCIAISGSTGASAQCQTVKLSPEQLDSLVVAIALYPDPLLAQVLAASTYPLEIVLLQRWLDTNKSLKDKQLADAAATTTLGSKERESRIRAGGK